jgi:hypothetical protein
MRIIYRFAVFTSVVALSCVAVGAALGHLSSGGANIASAPTIVPGQQEFGNTTDGCFENCDGADFWKLSLIAADQVTIDWETSPTNECSDGGADQLAIWAIGTTDYSINNDSPIQNFGIGSNQKAESTFTASTTGVYPVMFRSCYDQSSGGPYDFTVLIRHKVVVGLADQTRSLLQRARQGGRLPRHGVLDVLVHNADGGAISGAVGGTLSGYWSGSWHKLTGAIAAGGQVLLRYQLPASVHGVIRLQINIGGGSYQGANLTFRGVST